MKRLFLIATFFIGFFAQAQIDPNAPKKFYTGIATDTISAIGDTIAIKDVAKFEKGAKFPGATEVNELTTQKIPLIGTDNIINSFIDFDSLEVDANLQTILENGSMAIIASDLVIDSPNFKIGSGEFMHLTNGAVLALSQYQIIASSGVFGAINGSSQSLFKTSEINKNIAIGTNALDGIPVVPVPTPGNRNIAIGFDALKSMDFSIGNIALGYKTLENTSGQSNGFNIGIGNLALNGLQAGTENTAIGLAAGDNLINGHNNVYIGNVNASSPFVSGEVRIGGMTGLILDGDCSTGNVSFFGDIDTPGTIVAGTITATGGNSTDWNTAFGWGDHALSGYLTTETDPTTAIVKKGTGYKAILPYPDSPFRASPRFGSLDLSGFQGAITDSIGAKGYYGLVLGASNYDAGVYNILQGENVRVGDDGNFPYNQLINGSNVGVSGSSSYGLGIGTNISYQGDIMVAIGDSIYLGKGGAGLNAGLFSFGKKDNVNGIYSGGFGVQQKFESDGTWVIGDANVEFINNNRDAKDKPVLLVANGDVEQAADYDVISRSNAFVVYQGGAFQTFPIEIDATSVPNASAGMLAYDNSENVLKYHNGTEWKDIGTAHYTAADFKTDFATKSIGDLQDVNTPTPQVGDVLTWVGGGEWQDLPIRETQNLQDVIAENDTLTSDNTITTFEHTLEIEGGFDAGQKGSIVFDSSGNINISSVDDSPFGNSSIDLDPSRLSLTNLYGDGVAIATGLGRTALLKTDLLSAERTYQFPDQNGTLALKEKNTTSLNATEITASATTPIQIVPAQGAGTYIVIDHVIAKMDFATTAFDTDGWSIDVGGTQIIIPISISNATADIVQKLETSQPVLSENTAMTFSSNSAPMAGDGVLSLIIYYRIETF